nr:5'-3' exonuclease H3TH domain-containing protein [Ardenticatena sp.]
MRIQLSKVMLIDGHSLAFRAFYAIPPSFCDPTGRPSNLIYGFLMMLFRLVAEEQPDAVAVVFDKAHSFRESLYPAYKAGRQALDPAIAEQVERLIPLIEVVDIPIYIAEGYEADDVLATLTRQIVEKSDAHVLIVSGDRDMFALLSARVNVLYPTRSIRKAERYTPARLFERWRIRPEQVADFKALVGDPSDNIPGVRGIGEKTAARLLQHYPTLDAIYAHLDDLTPALRRKLEAGCDAAWLSLQLARLVDDVPGIVYDFDRPGLLYDPAIVDEHFSALGSRSVREAIPPPRR